jgi:hypothetical protein
MYRLPMQMSTGAETSGIRRSGSDLGRSSTSSSIAVLDPLRKTQMTMTVLGGVLNSGKYIAIGLGLALAIYSLVASGSDVQTSCWLLYAAATVCGTYELRKDWRHMQMVWSPTRESRLDLTVTDNRNGDSSYAGTFVGNFC